MSDDGLEHVSPASTTYGDWSGNVEADQSAMMDSLDVYGALGIDRDKWFVLGIEAHHHLTEPGVEVYAVDKVATGIGRNDDVSAYATKHGHVPVTSLYSHNVTPAGLFLAMFYRFGLQLRLRGTTDHDLIVVSREDLDLDEN